jgi:putrescine transport system substrate-binding protein
LKGGSFTLAYLLLSSASAAADEKVLNVCNWADGIGPTTLADFKAGYGISVDHDPCDSAAVVDPRLLAGKTGCGAVLRALRYSARLFEPDAPIDSAALPIRQKPDIPAKS